MGGRADCREGKKVLSYTPSSPRPSTPTHSLGLGTGSSELPSPLCSTVLRPLYDPFQPCPRGTRWPPCSQPRRRSFCELLCCSYSSAVPPLLQRVGPSGELRQTWLLIRYPLLSRACASCL